MAKVVKMEVKVPVITFREGKTFVAYTPSLDLSTSGKDIEQLKERFGEAVEILFEELLEKGTLEEVLYELGWKKINKGWTPPTPVSHEMEEIKVPVSV